MAGGAGDAGVWHAAGRPFRLDVDGAQPRPRPAEQDGLGEPHLPYQRGHAHHALPGSRYPYHTKIRARPRKGLALTLTLTLAGPDFQVTQWDDKDQPGLPSVEMQLLAEDFEVAASAPCESRWADGAPEATCGLGVLDCRDALG